MSPRRKPGPGKPRPSDGYPRPLKRLSQNFLVDARVAEKIVDLAQVGPEDTVLEIGPGRGALTRHLLQRGRHLHAVELDRKLFDRLRVEYDAEPRVSVHHGDVLQFRIRELVGDGPVVVVGNLPYAITSELVVWLLEQPRAVRRAVMLMQREVARRLTAEPGTREAGSLTYAVRYRTEPARLLDVSPGSFRPVPKVVSSLVALQFRSEPVVQPRDEKVFFRTIRAAFGERRKTLANALASGLARPRPEMEAVLHQVGLDPRIRGERLGLEEFRQVADVLVDVLNAPPPGGGQESRRRRRSARAPTKDPHA